MGRSSRRGRRCATSAFLVLRKGVRGSCDEAKAVRRAGDASAMLNRGGVWRNHPKLLGPGALIFVAKQL